ncbi:MAG: TRAP transporter large permease subunit [Hyphomicrobiaceae bacterium]
MPIIQPELLCLLMFVAACGFLIMGYPVAFTLGGTAIIFAFIGAALNVFDLTLLTAFPQRIFSTMTNDVLVAVPLFVFMGVMLERSRVAEELLDNMGRLFGPYPGGLVFSVSVVGALLAASTGIVGATVITMGLLSLPTMLKRGYSKPLACGSIAAAGTLGQIIPPSIVLVLLGDQLSGAYQIAQLQMGIFAPDTVSVNDLFAGALLPGLALVGMYIAYQLAFSFMYPHLAAPIPPEDFGTDDGRPMWQRLLGSLVAPLVLIIAVLGSILGGLASPTEAAAVGAVGATLLAGHKAEPTKGLWIVLGGLAVVAVLILTAFFDLRMQRNVISVRDWIAIGVAIGLSAVIAIGVLLALVRTFNRRTASGERVLTDVARQTMMISSMVFVILVGAAIFSLVFRGLKGDEWIEHFLQNMPGGTLAAMILVMGVMFLMGFFLDFLEIVFIVVPIVSPILLKMQFAGEPMNPVWLGVMMGLNLQTSFLTPPFGFALFYLRGVAPPEVTTRDIYVGIIPFVAIQVLALVVLWNFPQLATWLPKAIYGN